MLSGMEQLAHIKLCKVAYDTDEMNITVLPKFHGENINLVSIHTHSGGGKV